MHAIVICAGRSQYVPDETVENAVAVRDSLHLVRVDVDGVLWFCVALFGSRRGGKYEQRRRLLPARRKLGVRPVDDVALERTRRHRQGRRFPDRRRGQGGQRVEERGQAHGEAPQDSGMLIDFVRSSTSAIVFTHFMLHMRSFLSGMIGKLLSYGSRSNKCHWKSQERTIKQRKNCLTTQGDP